MNLYEFSPACPGDRGEPAMIFRARRVDFCCLAEDARVSASVSLRETDWANAPYMSATWPNYLAPMTNVFAANG
jgi:hypothetical protein